MKNVLVFSLALSFIGCSHSQTISVRIQKGDTLSELAMKHKISRKKLQKLNPNIKNPNIIIAGKNLKLRKK
tara:strand:+ start:991 stop:1203 length:213 start_codon:yes stop_codon:yes gene_type:complete